RVGRLAAEDRGRPAGAAQDLVEQRQLHLAVSLAAELRAEVAGPQALLAHPVLEGAHQLLVAGIGLVVRVAEDEVERLDLVPHEVVRPVEQLLVGGVGLEVPCHGATSCVASPDNACTSTSNASA